MKRFVFDCFYLSSRFCSPERAQVVVFSEVSTPKLSSLSKEKRLVECDRDSTTACNQKDKEREKGIEKKLNTLMAFLQPHLGAAKYKL